MDNTEKYYNYHVSNPELELLEQSIEEKISNIENTVHVLFEQSEENRYKYLEVNIFGNEDSHKQMNGLYVKNFHYNNRYSYVKIHPDYGSTFIVWDPNFQQNTFSWKFVNNGEIIAIFEDQILINPISSNKRTILKKNFERKTVYLKPLDFVPRSPHGNYYDHAIYKYVLYQVEINDQNYVMGLAKYNPFDSKWETFPCEKNGMPEAIEKISNEFALTVKLFLDKFSDPTKKLSIFDDHLPTSTYSRFPSNCHVHFFPLLNSNIASPPTHELSESMKNLAEAYRLYGGRKVESNIPGFWVSPIKENDDDDAQISENVDAQEYLSSADDKIESTADLLLSHNNDINLELHKEYEALQKCVFLHNKYETLRAERDDQWEEMRNKVLQNEKVVLQKEYKVLRDKRKEEYEEIKNMLNDYQMQTEHVITEYVHKLQESKLQNKNLLEEKESLQKRLFEERESFQKQLSEERESFHKQLFEEKEISKNQLKKIKEKNNSSTKTNGKFYNSKKELRTRIENMSRNETSFEKQVGKLDETNETDKQKTSMWKKKIENTYNEKVDKLQKQFDQPFKNFRLDYDDKTKQSTKSEVKTREIDVQIERNSNEEFVQTNELEENPNTPQNSHNAVII